MSAQDQSNFAYWYGPVSASLTTSAGNETIKVPAPSANLALLQSTKLSAGYAIADVWRPIGVLWTVVTTITVTAPVLTLRKNGVSAATGGTVTLAVIAADLTQMFYLPFSAYTFAAGDAVGDKWSLLVTTTSTAGAVTAQLALAPIRALGVNEGVAL